MTSYGDTKGKISSRSSSGAAFAKVGGKEAPGRLCGKGRDGHKSGFHDGHLSRGGELACPGSEGRGVKRGSGRDGDRAAERLATARPEGVVAVPRTTCGPDAARHQGSVQADGVGGRLGGGPAAGDGGRLQSVLQPAG